MTTVDQASPIPTSRKVLCVAYGVIAVAALIGTWGHLGPYLHSANDFFINFFRDTKVTSASRVATVDVLMLGVSIVILMVIEARKYTVRFVWAYIAAGFFVAVSVAFPLFLIARELRMGGSETPRLRTVDTILLAMLACGLAGLSVWIDVG
jgi:Terpene cyclase DEP1